MEDSASEDAGHPRKSMLQQTAIEIIASVIHQNEGGEISHLNLPDSPHSRKK